MDAHSLPPLLSHFDPPFCFFSRVQCCSVCKHCLRAESILATREGTQTLHGADALGVLLLGGEGATHGAGETGTQVQRDVLLALVELAELLRLGLVDDRQHTRNVLAGRADLHQLRRSAAGDLRNAERRKLRLEVVELLEKLGLALGAQFCRLHLRHFLSKHKKTQKKHKKNSKKKTEKKTVWKKELNTTIINKWLKKKPSRWKDCMGKK